MKKKKSPVKVVVPLILAVAAAGVGYKVVNRYIPSKEVMDGNEYFGTSGGEDAAVVLPDRLEQGKALVKDGTAYVEYATAKENLNDHLYNKKSALHFGGLILLDIYLAIPVEIC